MSIHRKRHLIDRLKAAGRDEDARRIESTPVDDMDFSGALVLGIEIADLLDDFNTTRLLDTSDDFTPGGGDFGGGGSGGDWD